MTKVIKVLFLIDTLRGGGAERVLVNLVNNMDRSEYDITVETMFDDGVNRSRLSPDINYFCRRAPRPRGIAQVFCLIPAKLLYRYFIGNKKYDVIIAYMHGAPTKVISGCTDGSVRKITWLHTGNPKNSSFFKFWFSQKKAIKAYADCDAIVGVCKSVADAFSEYTGITEKMQVVYNTNETDVILERSNLPVSLPFEHNRPMVCSVGSLVDAKGYDRLINASEKLHHEGIMFDLAILGKGKDEESLRAQINALNANDYVHLLGFNENPYPIMKEADLFISSSRQEGLATVVSESLILGVPVVSTDVSGARELLGENNEYGLVVENSDQGIYDGLKAMLTDQALLTHYHQKAKDRATFFSTVETVKQAQNLIDMVLEK